MRKYWRWGPVSGLLLGAALTALAVSGCSYTLDRVKPGENISEVERQAGHPTVVRKLADGTSAAYYVHGPGGYTTYRVRYQPNGQVIDGEQLLTESNFRAALVANVTTEQQVEDALGPPGLVTRYPNIGQVVWTYRWMNVQQPFLTDVHFNAQTGAVLTYSMYLDQCQDLSMQCF